MIRKNLGVAAFQAVAPKVEESSNSAQKYNNSGDVFRLQAVLNNRNYAQRGNNPPQVQESTTEVNQDSTTPENNYVASSYQDSNSGNEGNLYISQDVLGYNTPMSAEEQLKLVSQYEDKKLDQ